MIQCQRSFDSCVKVFLFPFCSTIIHHKIILFLALISGFLVSTPSSSLADVVGALMPSKNIPHYLVMHDAMVSELETRGVDVKIILQKPSASQLAWRNAMRKLDVLEATVFVSYGSALSSYVVEERPLFPVVYGGVYEPEESGVKGNVTGMDASFPLEELLATLKRISNYSKLAVLYSSIEPDSVLQMERVEKISMNNGTQVVKIDTRDMSFLDQAGDDAVFDTDFFNMSGAEALLMTSASNINLVENVKKIADNSIANGIATASVLSGTCEMGVLFSYAADPGHQGKGMAMKLIETLEGVRPDTIPPGKSLETTMTLNLTTAKKLGVSIPFELLGTAGIVK